MEAAIGFEPMNNGFADRCLSHLAMPPKNKTQTGSTRLTGSIKKIQYKNAGKDFPDGIQKSCLSCKSCQNFMERETGLEPATTTLATWGSTN
jgi:hypothetical protein